MYINHANIKKQTPSSDGSTEQLARTFPPRGIRDEVHSMEDEGKTWQGEALASQRLELSFAQESRWGNTITPPMCSHVRVSTQRDVVLKGVQVGFLHQGSNRSPCSTIMLLSHIAPDKQAINQ